MRLLIGRRRSKTPIKLRAQLEGFTACFLSSFHALTSPLIQFNEALSMTCMIRDEHYLASFNT